MPDADTTVVNDEDDDDMDDFVVPDDLSDDEPAPKPKRKSKSPQVAATPARSKSSSFNNKALEKFSSSSPYKTTPSSTPKASRPTPKKETPAKQSFEKMNEERYQWLVDIRDADGNRPDSPDYDNRTLYIPKSAWNKFTPFEKQYWEVKSKMWNTVVFFKKGKFYELYENDADIAHSTFDLKLAGGGRANMRLCGVPEMSFDYWASAFIAKGYKVARVDQVETALAKEMRETSNAKKEDKVIRRELSCVLTGGTLVDEGMLVDDMSTYCMAIKQNETNFAVCFVDTATGAFYITEFEDDVDYSQFETLVAQTRPRELILEKGVISMRAVRILKNNTSPSTLWNYLKPEIEFWDSDTAFENLVRAKYFEAEDLDDLSKYPPILKEICQSPKHKLSMSAFGALNWYLKSLKIDTSIISLGNFNSYEAINISKHQQTMILDGQSLQNLEIFANTFDGSSKGTLFQLLNRCITPFGKRQLQIWICHPLMNAAQINARLDAVEIFINNGEIRDFLERKLATLPDLERLLSRIHAGRLPPKDFARVIEGFQCIDSLKAGMAGQFGDEIAGSGDPNKKSLIGEIISQMPPIETLLPEWTSAVDWAEAKKNNKLVPEPGVEPDFDQSLVNIKEIEGRLNEKLREYRREFKSQEICYRDSGKEIYLIEVPNKVKNIPKNWQQMAATSKVKRYWSPEVKALARELMEALETHKGIGEQVQARLYHRFDQNYKQWLATVKSVSTLDCLLSLSKTSMALGAPSVRPEILEPEEKEGVSNKGVITFEELRHPCFDNSETNFIPNDIQLGGEEANLVLLTGANAAGKSTVLRMTCVAVIMAQMGTYVPAAKARLTPIDRIMTRLGANDNIFAGKSTFYVELSETKRMLTEATPRTLLVLDELGRGGSSSDGFAIAEAVLHHLASHVGSLGFFATHYNTLWSSFRGHPEVAPKQMAIMVDESSRNVTFLYKLVDGVSPGSFGMHVASMCGIDSSIVDRAESAASEYEHTSRMKRLLNVTSATHGGSGLDSEDSLKVVPLGAQSDLKWAMKEMMALSTGTDSSSIVDHGCDNEDLKLAKLGHLEDESRKEHALRCLLAIAKTLK